MRLLSRESGARETAEDVATGLGRVLGRLEAHLGRRFGVEGFHALAARTLDLVRAQNHTLGEDVPRSSDPTWSDTLAARLRERSAPDATEFATVLLATFIALLSRMLGPDLAARLVEESWRTEDDRNRDRRDGGRHRE